jgi:23S rRNA G2069 N7-methylase RlmK/C1962 C5-methylase RlmI
VGSRAIAGVLNTFAYTGAISIAAGLGGARIVESVDASKPALALAAQAWARNGLPDDRARFVAANVFEHLRASDETYDLVVVDPPPFVRRRGDVAAGFRGYKDVNLHAVKRLVPGGLPAHVLVLAARDAGRVPRDGRRPRSATPAGRAECSPSGGTRRTIRSRSRIPKGQYLKAMLVAV